MFKDGLAEEEKTSNQINSHPKVAQGIYNQTRRQHAWEYSKNNRPGAEPALPKTRHRAARNRSRMDIVSAMLEAAHGDGTIKTRIKRKVHMSFTQLTEYLNYLLENEMLEYDRKTRLYRVTEKGLHFARMYRKIGGAISPKRRRER
jgi:predicted transcriptional regulator